MAVIQMSDRELTRLRVMVGLADSIAHVRQPLRLIADKCHLLVYHWPKDRQG